MNRLFFTLLPLLTSACELAKKREVIPGIEALTKGYAHACDGASAALGSTAFFAGANAGGPVTVGSDSVSNVNETDPNYGRIDILNLYKESRSGEPLFVPSWDLSKLSLARSGLALAAGSNRVYIGGGQLSIRDYDGGPYDFTQHLRTEVDIFDAEGVLQGTTNFSEPRASAATLAYAGKIFFAGGFNGKVNEYGALCQSGRCFYRSWALDIYDEASGSWSTLQMPDDRLGTWLVGLNNKIYIGGGSTNNYGNFYNVLDLADHSWSKLDLAHDLVGSTVALDDKFYIGCNYKGNLNVLDPVTGGWSEIIVPTPLYPCSVFLVGRKIVVATGNTLVTTINTYPAYSGAVQLYDIDTGTWQLTNLPLTKTLPSIVSAADRFLVFAGGLVDGITVSRVDIYDSLLEKWFTNNGEEEAMATTHSPGLHIYTPDH